MKFTLITLIAFSAIYGFGISSKRNVSITNELTTKDTSCLLKLLTKTKELGYSITTNKKIFLIDDLEKHNVFLSLEYFDEEGKWNREKIAGLLIDSIRMMQLSILKPLAASKCNSLRIDCWYFKNEMKGADFYPILIKKDIGLFKPPHYFCLRGNKIITMNTDAEFRRKDFNRVQDIIIKYYDSLPCSNQ